MRFDLGAMILIVAIALSVWAIRKIAAPAKRTHGLRIRIPAAERDERKNDPVDR